GKAEPLVRQVKSIAGWIHEGRCKHLNLEDIGRFLDSYMSAYPRDGEATQAQYVARAYLDYFRGDYTSFHEHMNQALDAHPNLSLAYSTCSQFAVIGGPEQGCECFQKYEYLLGRSAPANKTIVQKLLARVDTNAVGFRVE